VSDQIFEDPRSFVIAREGKECPVDPSELIEKLLGTRVFVLI